MKINYLVRPDGSLERVSPLPVKFVYKYEEKMLEKVVGVIFIPNPMWNRDVKDKMKEFNDFLRDKVWGKRKERSVWDFDVFDGRTEPSLSIMN